jgi:hypothetical protein
MERGGGGWLGAATRQEEGRGGGVHQGHATAVVSRRLATCESGGGVQLSVNRGAWWGSDRGEKRRARGRPRKERNMGPTQKNSIRFDLFRNFSNDSELI